MAKSDHLPRTRLEDIMLVRGVSAAEIVRRGLSDSSTLSRMVTGKISVSNAQRPRLAMILQCAESDLLLPVGAPVSPPPGRGALKRQDDEFNKRLAVMLTALGVGRLEDLTHYLISGDYSHLPVKLAKRFREIAKHLNDDGSPA